MKTNKKWWERQTLVAFPENKKPGINVTGGVFLNLFFNSNCFLSLIRSGSVIVTFIFTSRLLPKLSIRVQTFLFLSDYTLIMLIYWSLILLYFYVILLNILQKEILRHHSILMGRRMNVCLLMYVFCWRTSNAHVPYLVLCWKWVSGVNLPVKCF